MPKRTDIDADSPPPLRGRAREGGRPTKRARELRRAETVAERLLWAALRRAQIEGVQFRRQQPIGSFIVDFFCPAAGLIVEVDGEQHGNEGVHASDTERRRWLEAQGYHVIRFWNEDVKNNCEGVTETIRLIVRERKTPLPDPPPQGGRGNANGNPAVKPDA